MQLPIEKQFEIMDRLRLEEPIRYIHKKAHAAKSTVQDYKKHGPPIFRKYSANHSDVPYPASLQEENIWLRQSFLKIERISNQTIEQLNRKNKEITSLTMNKTWIETKYELLKEDYEKQLIQRDETIRDLESKNNQHINDKEKLRKQDEEKNKEMKAIQGELQKTKTDLTTTTESLNRIKKEMNNIIEERDKYKDKAEDLEEKAKHDPEKYLLAFGGGIAAYFLFDRFVLPYILNLISSFSSEQGKSANVENTGAPIPQPGIIQPDIPYINSGVNLDINTSGSLCSGAYPSYSADSTVFPKPQDGLLQSDIQGTRGNVTFSTITPSTIQTSGVVIVDHIETINIRPTLQTSSSHYVPPPLISPVYFYHPITPVPPELTSPYGWIPIKQMNPRQFLLFLGWLYHQRWYKVTIRDKPHDKGCDILLEGAGETIVNQVKCRKETTNTKALGEVLLAKELFHATKARIISFSPFTKEVKKDAEKANIELLDLDGVLAELRKYNIYYPID